VKSNSIPIIFFLLVFTLSSLTLAQPQIGNNTPGFITSTLDGKRVALKEYWEEKGTKVIILSFFATWCSPCIDDLKYLQKIQRLYEGKGLRVICVLTQDMAKENTVKDFMKKLGVSLPVLLDEYGIIGKRYQITALPANFLIDKEGILQATYFGYNETTKRHFEIDLKNQLSKDSEK